MTQIIADTYELIGKIGSGGGGVVYLANHIRLGKKVVMKADKRTIKARPEILRREVDALKNLSHTYIPHVYDFFADGETVYTIMDYIEGESLDIPLKRGERFTQPQVIKWACQLLEALCYLHGPSHGNPPKGIVHSDIKPSNIMLTPYGDICLIDFNIALALGEENIVGRSAGYASPEHYGLDFSADSSFIDDGETEVMDDSDSTVPMNHSYTSSKKIVIPDARSDIYSLGATLYHLLTRRRPASRAVDVDKLSDKEFSSTIVDIISKAMNPNADLRYQTAEEMLDAFKHLRENDPRMIRYRKNKIAAGILFLSILTVGIFFSFTGLKRMEITQKALALAEYSQNALAAGDSKLAVELALQAIPEKGGILAPEYAPEIKRAFSDALGVYDLSDGYKPSNVLELPSETFKIAVSPDGKTGAAVYAFAVAIFNTETGEIIVTLPTVRSALADIEFVNNNIVVYAGEKGISAYDIVRMKELWTGRKVTEISVSSDGNTVAGVYRDEDMAYVYDMDGHEKMSVSFEGKKQKVAVNDTFANPGDNLFSLNSDGTLLAISFNDGALKIFDLKDPDNSVEIYDESEFIHFEGGFSQNYFAFSSTGEDKSVFAVIDMERLEQTGGFALNSRIGVIADKNGIFISNNDVVVKIHPVTGEQEEVAYTNSDIRAFSIGSNGAVISAGANEYMFFDRNANYLTSYNNGYNSCDFVSIAGDYCVVAGRDTPTIKILKRVIHHNDNMFTYNTVYNHDEARIKSDGTRVMLFDYRGFSLYDDRGSMLTEVFIPDSEFIYDQQYSKLSGNLAVLYKDALRIYSGSNGNLIYERGNLKSVFYAPYGISIVDKENKVSLINIDTIEVLDYGKIEGDFGAFCGMVVDRTFLDGGELIGAAKTDEGYLFAVSKGTACTVYNDMGKKKFDIPSQEQSEAFFTEGAVIISPLHGTPSAYSLRNGKKISDLEKDSYLTYITQAGKYIVSEYISSEGKRYGILLEDSDYKAIAYLPCLTDISGNELVFDYHKGTLRKTRIYSIEELINSAKEVNLNYR